QHQQEEQRRHLQRNLMQQLQPPEGLHCGPAGRLALKQFFERAYVLSRAPLSVESCGPRDPRGSVAKRQQQQQQQQQQQLVPPLGRQGMPSNSSLGSGAAAAGAAQQEGSSGCGGGEEGAAAGDAPAATAATAATAAAAAAREPRARVPSHHRLPPLAANSRPCRPSCCSNCVAAAGFGISPKSNL
ncbi:hypothetical protein ETH_00043615, partial [Eimeria tenella]